MKYKKKKFIYRYTLTDREKEPLIVLVRNSLTSVMLAYVDQYIYLFNSYKLLLQRDNNRIIISFHDETALTNPIRYFTERNENSLELFILLQGN